MTRRPITKRNLEVIEVKRVTFIQQVTEKYLVRVQSMPVPLASYYLRFELQKKWVNRTR